MNTGTIRLNTNKKPTNHEPKQPDPRSRALYHGAVEPWPHLAELAPERGEREEEEENDTERQRDCDERRCRGGWCA